MNALENTHSAGETFNASVLSAQELLQHAQTVATHDWQAAMPLLQDVVAFAALQNLPAVQADALSVLGDCFDQQGDWSAAERCFRTASELDRAQQESARLAISTWSLALMLEKQMNYAEAVPVIDEALALHTKLNTRYLGQVTRLAARILARHTAVQARLSAHPD